MNHFIFECSNCKAKQIVFSNEYIQGDRSNENMRRFKASIEFLVSELGWVRMHESEVAGFHDHLCPKCK